MGYSGSQVPVGLATESDAAHRTWIAGASALFTRIVETPLELTAYARGICVVVIRPGPGSTYVTGVSAVSALTHEPSMAQQLYPLRTTSISTACRTCRIEHTPRTAQGDLLACAGEQEILGTCAGVAGWTHPGREVAADGDGGAVLLGAEGAAGDSVAGWVSLCLPRRAEGRECLAGGGVWEVGGHVEIDRVGAGEVQVSEARGCRRERGGERSEIDVPEELSGDVEPRCARHRGV